VVPNKWRQGNVTKNCFNIYTGWLKLKYPTGQNAISQQTREIFIPKFLGLYGTDPATILNFFCLDIHLLLILYKLLIYYYNYYKFI